MSNRAVLFLFCGVVHFCGVVRFGVVYRCWLLPRCWLFVAVFVFHVAVFIFELFGSSRTGRVRTRIRQLQVDDYACTSGVWGWGLRVLFSCCFFFVRIQNPIPFPISHFQNIGFSKTVVPEFQFRVWGHGGGRFRRPLPTHCAKYSVCEHDGCARGAR